MGLFKNNDVQTQNDCCRRCNDRQRCVTYTRCLIKSPLTEVELKAEADALEWATKGYPKDGLPDL